MKPIDLPPMVVAAERKSDEPGLHNAPGEWHWRYRNGKWWTVNEDLNIENGPFTVVQCAWFLLCENDATTARDHPVLGSVPICDRCNTKVEALS